jgi:cell division protein FtsB
MREFQDKQKIKNRIYSKTSVFILFIFIVLIGRGVLSVYAKERDSRMELDLLEKKKAELGNRLANVSTSNDRLNTEEGIESEIRSKFDVVKQDEGVIVVVDEKLPPPPEDTRGFMKKFWDSVTGVFKKEEKKDDVKDAIKDPADSGGSADKSGKPAAGTNQNSGKTTGH